MLCEQSPVHMGCFTALAFYWVPTKWRDSNRSLRCYVWKWLRHHLCHTFHSRHGREVLHPCRNVRTIHCDYACKGGRMWMENSNSDLAEIRLSENFSLSIVWVGTWPQEKWPPCSIACRCLWKHYSLQPEWKQRPCLSAGTMGWIVLPDPGRYVEVLTTQVLGTWPYLEIGSLYM